MPAGIVTLALRHMAATAQHRHLLARGDLIGGRAAVRQAVLFTRAMAGIASHVLLEMRMTLDIAGGFTMAGLAKLMHLGTHRKRQQKEPVPHATCFRTNRRVIVPRFGCPASAMASFSSAFSIHITRSTPGWPKAPASGRGA